MNKTTAPTPVQKWVGIDLHVHTPASDDYQGPRERSEYLKIIQRANEFEAGDVPAVKARTKRATKPISCLAFTDHNSVNGFKEWRNLYDETVSLAEAVRDRDPNNALLQQLDKDLSTLRSVRVLMGLELSAYPGVHLLVIFHESVKPEAAEAFLQSAYGVPYGEIAGKPGPITTIPIEELLEQITQAFGDHAIVVAPHIESGGGVYDVLKDLHQILMPVIRHSALQALSFNKSETRDRMKDLLSQPQYARTVPLALIQSSDSHGNRGSVGQPRTEIKISGKPTFTAIREAFRAGRLKCSVDFVSEEYSRLTEGEVVRKFVGSSQKPTFKKEDHNDLVNFVCAALNSPRGVVQLDLTQEGRSEVDAEQIVQEIHEILGSRLEPSGKVTIFSRTLAFSATRVRLLLKPVPLNRLYTIQGVVYVLDGESVRPARATEIETKVAELIEMRFGRRFRETLERVSEESVLLSKMPEGIPLFLRAREHLSFFSLKKLGLTKIESTATRGREIAEEARSLYRQKVEETPFGLHRGNTSILTRTDIRFKEHYTRYFCFTVDVSNGVAEKLAGTHIEKTSVIVTSGGAALLCDPSYIIANAPAVLLDLPSELQNHAEACVGWLKSSFFIWYCAVHLSDKDLYQQLQKPDIRLPFPNLQNEEFYRRLGGLVRNVVIEEKRFLDEVRKQDSRGSDRKQREKLRTRHNNTVNAVCLTIDREVYKALGLTEEEIEFVSRSITDMGLTDFGLLAQIENEAQAEDDEGQAGED